MAQQPDSRIASKVLPGPFYRALVHVFAQNIPGCMLVGGTALAGYYAGHRRSDDLDLFTKDDDAHRAATLAVRSLQGLGARVHDELSSSQYYKATCQLGGHAFNADVVLDDRIHVVGQACMAGDGVVVASLETLLKQKAATLVSRCSEKDLYDLVWLLQARPDIEAVDLLDLGSQIDGGLNAETVLISLVGTELSVAACGFSLTESDARVFAIVGELKKALEVSCNQLASNQPAPPIGHLVQALRRGGSPPRP